MECSSSLDPAARTRRGLPRFSLLALLLLVAIVALSITVVLLWRELLPLRVENKRLNEERGTLMFDDRSKLQAIRIPDRFAGEGRESYRVFVPEEAVYWAFVVVNDVPKEGYPKVEHYPEPYSLLGSGTKLPLHARLEPGEHVLTIRKVRRGADKTQIVLLVDDLDASANSAADRWPTVEPSSYIVFEAGVKGATTAADNSRRLVLQRRRIMGVTEDYLDAGFSIPEPDGTLDGVILWIEADPRKK